MLLTNREKANEHCYHPLCELRTVLRINNTDLPLFSEIILENHLSSNLVAPKPFILKYVPNVVIDLPSLDSDDAQVRHDRELCPEIVGMLTGALAAD